MRVARSTAWPGAAASCLALAVGACGGGGGGSEGSDASVDMLPESFTVTAEAGPGGGITPSTLTVRQDETAEFTVFTTLSHDVQDVTGCGGTLSGSIYSTAPVTSDCTVIATFAVKTYTLLGTSTANGSISPTSVEVDYGHMVTFTATPDEGFRTKGLAGCDGDRDGDTLTTNPITGVCDVHAIFERIPPGVSGTITPVPGSAVDTDVNNQREVFLANDDFDDAQPLGNPVTLGGHVNRSGSGNFGITFAPGDVSDYYQVELQGGQSVVLMIASGDTGDDLDLYLYDQDEALVDASLDPAARTEFVTVPADADGEYFLEVHAFSGASRYQLVIGQPFVDAAPTMRLTDAFVPGEVILRHREDASSSIAGVASGRNRLVELDRIDMYHSGTTLPGPNAGATPGHAARLDRLAAHDATLRERLETLYAIKTLGHDPNVAFTAPNYLHELARFTPDDPDFTEQWHYPMIGLPEAWELSTGEGIIVAVIDTGVLLGHPDLAGQTVPGHDFILDVPGGDDPGATPRPLNGSFYHGTHVAGTIAASTDNQLMVAGIAFDARLMPLRACGAAICSGFAIEQALRFAAGLPNDTGTLPERPADVINMSLGRGGPPLIAEEALYRQLHDAGIVVVASAGNLDSRTPLFPAGYDDVIGVGAVDDSGGKAWYSNFGTWVDLVAPGGDTTRGQRGSGGVLSTWADDSGGDPDFNTRFLNGTSMAAPHVSGVIALMRAANTALTPTDIDVLIANGAISDDLGEPGKDDFFGFGLINADKAVTAAIARGDEQATLDPRLEARPRRLYFGLSRETMMVTLFNAGDGDVTLGTPDEDSGGWLDVTLDEDDGRPVATLTVDREGMPEGLHEATVTFPSDANPVEVDVFMHVVDAVDRRIGTQFVVLMDPDRLFVKYMRTARLNRDREFDFLIENVAPGNYLLFSGSDLANSGFICAFGDSCGLYRSIGEAKLIRVRDEHIEGIDFFAGYDFAFDTATREDLPGRIRLPRE